MESTFTFLRVRGIPIGANWSWLLVFAYLTWSLGSALFPRTYPGLTSSAYLVMGLVTALLFFGSILLHELGHAFRALKEGMRIEGITLWLFGGVARFSGMFPSAGAEFRIAIAGPLVSVVLAASFGVLAWAGHGLGWTGSVRGVLDYLARINGLVVAFNMVPALPLDGGRVLRSWLWHRQGSFTAATVSAARAGRAFGGLLIAVGVLGFVSGAGVGGLWFVLIGWFLLQAAQAEASFALLRRAFRGLRVGDLMTPDPAVVPPDMTVARFVDEVAHTMRHSTYPVVEAGRLSGLMSLRRASEVPQDARERTLVRDVMLPADDVPTLTPHSEVLDALTTIRPGIGRAVVVDDGRVAGVLSASDVSRALELEKARGVAPEPGVRRAGWTVWAVVVVLMAAAAGLLYHPPVAEISPGETVDVSRDVTISGAASQRPTGRYLLTSVRLSQPTALGVAWAAVRGNRELVALSSVVPSGTSEEQFLRQQRSLFRESQVLAAAAAAREVGLNVSIVGTGAHVLGVVRGSPAAGVLRTGDVITAVDGQPVHVVSDLRTLIGTRPAGTQFVVSIDRSGARRDVRITSTRLPSANETIVGIGVSVETRGLDVKLPFKIHFRNRPIGGPSAGLAYALAIEDMLDPANVAHGRTVAATGTIDVDGRVGAVGGVREKTEAVRRAGAAIFLVPAAEVNDARGQHVEVRGVSSLGDAVAALRTGA